MQDFITALRHAFDLIISMDVHLREIIALSFYVSLMSLAIASSLGLLLGAVLVVSRFPGRKLLIIAANACMGFPPVVMGLVVYLLLSRGGVLGALQLLYTPTAMIIAQSLLVLPLIVALSYRVIDDLYREYGLLLRVLRIDWWGYLGILLWDARYSLLTVVLAGFGRAISEVGAMIIVGGNIAHLTRVMTTSIALETSKGNLALALSLGMILMLVALLVNVLVFVFGAWVRRYEHV